MSRPVADPVALEPFPRLHIRPERGWVNDPNGIGRWDGRWHVFYQHNPDAPVHDAICWGHASSADLLTWRDDGVALRPRPGRIDAAGVWSGVATTGDDGAPVLVYTAVPDSPANAGVALARRRPGGGWEAGERFVATSLTEQGIRDVRDPFLLRIGGRRYAILGAGRTDGTPLVLIYDATDLERWRLLGPLLDGADPAVRALAPAEIWECPSLVRLGGDDDPDASWALIVSRWRAGGDHQLRGVAALTGTVDVTGDHPRFVPSAGHPLDDGPDFYAPQAYDDGDRVLLWGWTWEGHGPGGRSADDVAAAGWAGALTFPRELALRDGRVTSEPARELTGLRRAELAAGGPELRLAVPAWEVVTGGSVAVSLDGPDGSREVWRTPPGTDGGARVLVDGSVVEAFAGGAPSTVRAYPAPGESWTVRAGDGAPLTAWELGPPTP